MTNYLPFLFLNLVIMQIFHLEHVSLNFMQNIIYMYSEFAFPLCGIRGVASLTRCSEMLRNFLQRSENTNLFGRHYTCIQYTVWFRSVNTDCCI